MQSFFTPRLCLALVGVCSLISWNPLSGAQEAEAKDVAAKAQATASKGLAYLKAHQQPDGSLGTKGYGQSVAAASLAGRAFLMSGEKGPSDEYREAYEKSLSYVLAHVNAEGIVKEPEGSIAATMYNEAYVAAFLAQAYRHQKQDKTLEKLKLTTKVILDAQNDEGAWRYQFKKADGDSSVTASAVMALLAAKEAGVEVPQESLDKALAYLQKLQTEDGGFRYTAAAPNSAFPRSAAVAAALAAAGGTKTASVERARKYLDQFQPSKRPGSSLFVLHGYYYSVQVMCGDDSPQETRDKWYADLVGELSRGQKKEGNWEDPMFGPEFSTATACVILQWRKAGRF